MRRRRRRRDTLISVASVLTLMAARVGLITPAAGICFGWIQFLSLFSFFNSIRCRRRERVGQWNGERGQEGERQRGRKNQ